MKNTIIVLFLAAASLFIYKFSRKPSMPKPTDGQTVVKTDAEESDNQNKREKWFNLLHQAAPGVDWRAVEAENSLVNLQIKEELRKAGNNRGSEEWVADGNILGQWFERGSTNQAGNVITAAYDREADEIFVVSGGGSLFKGNRSGIGWEVINQDLRFTHNLMECVFLPDGTRRLVTSINHAAFYSDDEGKTWKASEGMNGLDGAYLYHSRMTNDQKIFLLQKRSYWAPLRFFVSDNLGESFTPVHNFNTHDNRNIALAMEDSSGDMYVIFQQDVQRSHIYKYDAQLNELVQITADSPFGFGSDGDANLQVVKQGNQVKMYAYDGDLKFHVSDDFGKTWTYLSTLPTKPWSVSLFVSPSNPNHMIYGEVDAFRSRDAGKTWQKINAWWEYYNNVNSKLHADIMALREFTDPDDNPFVLISNHGGMSITYDMGVTNDNIGLYDLNVSQYYDVKSYPPDPNFIFAGSQDQGFQKGFMPGTNPETMVQVISGDYGHIEFTENGQRLWTVYPGGWVTYYPNPRSSGSVASFEVNSDNESVWIPPIIAGPDLAENAVYMAGGNINGGSGSHMIKLQYNAQNNRIDASQFAFNFRTSGGELSAMAFSPFNPSKIYCATTNGKFYISQNGGQHFTPHGLNLPGAQYLYGSCILPSKIDSNIVYMSGTGYSTPGVMISRNGGKTFTGMRTGLPNTMVFELAFNEDESLIYAATEAGPYVYIKSLEKWFFLAGSHTPNQTFWSVEYIPGQKIARFGTYGRGIWDFHFKEVMTTSSDFVNDDNTFQIFPNPARDFITLQHENSTGRLNRLTIFDVQGKKMSFNREDRNIDISAWPAGTYFIHLEMQNKSQIKKFIKL